MQSMTAARSVGVVGVATGALAPAASPGRASPCRCSAFLGSGVQSSRSSLLFSHERLLAKQAVAPRRRRERAESLKVQALFGLGVPELAVIAGVAAILFGPKKLPEIGKNLGKTVKSFQQAAKEFETEVKTRAAAADPTTGDEEDKTGTIGTPTSVSKPTSKSTSTDRDNV